MPNYNDGIPLVTEVERNSGELEKLRNVSHSEEDRRGVQAYEENIEANDALIAMINQGTTMGSLFVPFPFFGIMSEDTGDSSIGQHLPSGTFIPLKISGGCDPTLGF